MKKILPILFLVLVVSGCDLAEAPEYIDIDEENTEVEEVELEEVEAPTEEEPVEVEAETEAETPEEPASDPVETTSDETVQAEYSLEAVAQHSSKESCWSVIDGKVYDLTSWISKHPGGAGSILRICGVDGTAAFNSQHGGDNHAGSTLGAYYLSDLQ